MKKTLSILLLATLIVSDSKAITWADIRSFYNEDNDPNGIRIAVSLCTAAVAGIGIAYSAVQTYLNSPWRIARKYRPALATYRAHQDKNLVARYECFNQEVQISYDTLVSDIARLEHSAHKPEVQALKNDLLELKSFVYAMDTYLLEKKLKNSLEEAHTTYSAHIKIVSSQNDDKAQYIKRAILRATSARYPYTNFESSLKSDMRDLDRLIYTLQIRSHHNTMLISHAQTVYNDLRSILGELRTLSEFREEQKERERIRLQEEKARQDAQYQREKLHLERMKLTAELEKSQSQQPQVIINNTTHTTSQPTQASHNPYTQSGYYDPDGYYIP